MAAGKIPGTTMPRYLIGCFSCVLRHSVYLEDRHLELALYSRKEKQD